MVLTGFQTGILILSIAAGTMLTRFLPFLIFPEHRKIPPFILTLGRTLPSAMMGLLIVYCLKNVSLIQSPFGIPELLSLAVVYLLHKWKNKALLSIAGGTVVYMILVQALFVA